MRVLMAAPHRYPAFAEVGAGRQAVALPSNSGSFISDCLAKGLAELGHEVFYWLEGGADSTLPSGVELVSQPVRDADVFHDLQRDDGPWVKTVHLCPRFAARPVEEDQVPHWIFVSRTLARRYRSRRYVLNGIDPAAYVYSETKGADYLFVASMDRYEDKGLPIALSLARDLGFRLVVAGSSRSQSTVRRVARLCRQNGARYVGDVRGHEKAELFAAAKALIFPSRLPEGCPLVIAEALMSGTPVVASDQGGCPEMVSGDVGFVCATYQDYVAAIHRIDEISAAACRRRALEQFHYRQMAAAYQQEFEKEIGSIR